jgi:signal transduction histidine kinase
VGASAVAVDVTDTVHAQQSAERAHAAAAALAQLRSDLVAAVSHELRTPLTSVIGYGELLLARWEQLSDTERRDRLGRMVLSANRQKRLVEDLLLLSRLDDELTLLHPQCVQVAALLRQVADETKGAYPGQVIELVGSDETSAWADADRTLQIVSNLVDNAAKYSAEGCPVVIRWGPEGMRAVIRVHDMGTGIPDGYREHLFTRFGRIPGSRIRDGHVGTGLGLHIGRRLAAEMNGSLDLEQSTPNGSVFRLELPLYS